MYLFASNDSFQTVDGPQRARSMVCDGKDRILKFQNFVTAHSWMERIRWDEAGSYSIGMEFDIGKEVALSYRCQKPDTSISPVL